METTERAAFGFLPHEPARGDQSEARSQRAVGVHQVGPAPAPGRQQRQQLLVQRGSRAWLPWRGAGLHRAWLAWSAALRLRGVHAGRHLPVLHEPEHPAVPRQHESELPPDLVARGTRRFRCGPDGPPGIPTLSAPAVPGLRHSASGPRPRRSNQPPQPDGRDHRHGVVESVDVHSLAHDRRHAVRCVSGRPGRFRRPAASAGRPNAR